MTDFNKFNPGDKNLGGAKFNKDRNQKGAKSEKPAETPEVAKADPYKDQKLDPAYMMDLMAAHSNVPDDVRYASIYKSVGSFVSQYPPGRLEAIEKNIRQVCREDFQGAPESLVADVLVDYVAGRPVIENA